MDLVVPVAVELITFQTDPSELFIVYFGPSRVDATIDFGFFSSAMPWRITARETPVARETAEIPPLSKARLSAAATRRRDRSSSNLLRAPKRVLIPPRSATSPAYAGIFLIGNVIS